MIAPRRITEADLHAIVDGEFTVEERAEVDASLSPPDRETVRALNDLNDALKQRYAGRLEEPLTRYAVTAVLHGHAHNGALEGRTSTDVPVYNVAYPLMRKLTPQRPFRVLEI